MELLLTYRRTKDGKLWQQRANLLEDGDGRRMVKNMAGNSFWELIRVELPEGKQDTQERRLITKLLTLLDQIEVEDDASLAAGRFDILQNHGTVTFGQSTSGEKQ